METWNIKDLAATMVKHRSGTLWQRQFFDRYPGHTVKLVPYIDRQKKIVNNLNVMTLVRERVRRRVLNKIGSVTQAQGPLQGAIVCGCV